LSQTIISKPEKKTGEIKQLFMEHFDKIDNIRQNYSFVQINREKINEG